MTKLYIVTNTILEKEQIDSFSFIVVKNCFAITIAEFHYISDIILLLLEEVT